MWKRFTELFGGDFGELALISLGVAICCLIASVGLIIHWVTTGRYAGAAILTVMLGGMIGICARDYRRQKWSLLSKAIVLVWFLITVAVAVSIMYVEATSDGR